MADKLSIAEQTGQAEPQYVKLLRDAAGVPAELMSS